MQHQLKKRKPERLTLTTKSLMSLTTAKHIKEKCGTLEIMFLLVKFFEGNNRVVWNKACREAELGYGYKLGGTNSKYQKMFKDGPTLHDLRFSYIWLNEQLGISRKDTMAYGLFSAH